MARVTVEDCVQKVPNRFDLILLAGQRSRDIAGGATLNIPREDEKNPVIALREIADTDLDLDQLNGTLVAGLQRFRERDEPEMLDDDDAFAQSMADAGEFDNAVSEDALSDLDQLPNLDEDDEIDAELDEVNEDVMANEQLRDEAMAGMIFEDDTDESS